ncbi:MAG: SDR family NAD(P)-dependent oxidoreductase, partial [Pseudomonadota bacterium]
MTTVLVTGANRGIGLEFVRQYAESGAAVIACCRKPGGAADLAAIAEKYGGRVEIMELDVADAASVELLGRTLDGRAIDILINNAGVKGGDRQQFGGIDYHAWQHCLTVNLMGPMRLCETLAANVAAGRERKILNISSRMGSIGEAAGGAYIYRTSKAALNMASRLLARDLAEKGIRFIGCGISGGEEGARHGPSIMPGGDKQAWPAVQPILQAIAARVDDEPCCQWVGENGAGHYVKMVHNGIEYGDMQLISEAYQ